MENLAKIVSIPAIIVIVYATMAVYARIVGKKHTARKLIPLWSLIVGAFLEVIALVNFPEIVPTPGIFCAMLLGGVAGLAAVGLNQIITCIFEKLESTAKNPEPAKEEEDKQ